MKKNVFDRCLAKSVDTSCDNQSLISDEATNVGIGPYNACWSLQLSVDLTVVLTVRGRVSLRKSEDRENFATYRESRAFAPYNIFPIALQNHSSTFQK